MSEKLNVAVVDYGMGNVKSLENAISRVGNFNILVTGDSDLIRGADVIVLPGVGAFAEAMKKLKDRNLLEALNDVAIKKKKPVLGICLGMQLLFETSEEKSLTEGLGWIPGQVVYIRPELNLRIPHIGWNSLVLSNQDSMFSFLNHDKDFYFIHSLHVECEDQYVLARFEYGDLMIAAVKNQNVVGMQFHPEKSHKNGLKVLSSFFEWAMKRIGSNHVEN